MHGSTRALTTLAIFAVTIFAACGGPTTVSPAADKKPLPAVSLTEARAFPASGHVESSDLASGAYTFDRLFKAGAGLFHTSFNGLDGVGIAVRPNGTRVARFAPLCRQHRSLPARQPRRHAARGDSVPRRGPAAGAGPGGSERGPRIARSIQSRHTGRAGVHSRVPAEPAELFAGRAMMKYWRMLSVQQRDRARRPAARALAD